MDQLEPIPIPGTEGADNPFFSPDGQWVGFFAGGKLKKVPISGGAPLTLCEAQNVRGASWGTNDTIIFTPTGNSELWQISAEGGMPQEVTTLDGDQSHRWPEFLPDGKTVLFTVWLAGATNWSRTQIVAQRHEAYVQPFPGPGGKQLVSTEGGQEPVWARNGRELFYRNGNQMMAVEITTEPNFSAGTPTMLFEGDFRTGAVSRADYDVTPDGQRFLMVHLGDVLEVSQINLVLNWFEELKQRVPTGQ